MSIYPSVLECWRAFAFFATFCCVFVWWKAT